MNENESIETPFGAKDSELKGWEYTIPEGMEAEIKDGKIIVREKESEDERIRKELCEIVNDWCNERPSFIIDKEYARKILTWLEKQGEQKPNVCEGCNNVKGCVACVDGSEWAHIEEQNPAWSEEDEIGFCDAIWAIEQARTIAKNENDMGNLWYAENWLKALKERYTWKPSDEQLEALECAERWYCDNMGCNDALLKLLCDLKKLIKQRL